MRICRVFVPVVLVGVLVSLGVTGVVTAAPTRTQTSSLRFITSGLSCSNGVCALASGPVAFVKPY
jgi:hypothetical protein